MLDVATAVTVATTGFIAVMGVAVDPAVKVVGLNPVGTVPVLLNIDVALTA